MSMLRCPHCGRHTIVVQELGRPSPKSLRTIQVRERCIYCNAILSVRGGAFTPFWQVLPLLVAASCLALAITLWPQTRTLHIIGSLIDVVLVMRIVMVLIARR